jgi:ankyrin repeat protein
MYFLLSNNSNYALLNCGELCRLAIRNENLEILESITSKYINDNSLLHYASAQKNLNIFNHVIKIVNKYNEEDAKGETPLHWAVMRSSFHIVESLLSVLKANKLEIDHKTKYGLTPFHLACIKGDKNVCGLLYENGANINELDNEGNSIIHMLSAIGDLKWLKYVIKNYNPNCYLKNNKGDTPLFIAILNGRYDIVEYFIDKYPNLNWKNKYGQTPLHAAVFANQVKIIELLIKNKADISIKDIVIFLFYY